MTERLLQMHRAYRVLQRAILSGKLPAPKTLDCFDCPKRFRSRKASEYDHYQGYDEPNQLVVQPVCRSCHMYRKYERGELTPPWTGKRHSLETRKKIRQAAIGRYLSPETKIKIGISVSKRFSEPEMKMKLRNAHLGKKRR